MGKGEGMVEFCVEVREGGVWEKRRWCGYRELGLVDSGWGKE
jgi:hypothetical protein